MSSPEARVSARRRIAVPVLIALLAVPASASLPLIRWNLHVWSRLRSARREAPDVSYDRMFRGLSPYLPPAGRVGLVFTGPPPSSAEIERIQALVQYALAPRLIVRSADPEFVIACGASAPGSPLDERSGFHLVRSIDDELRLFRRVRP